MEREATKVLSGEEYDHLFPRALLTTIIKKKDATVKDTLKLIPQIVNETLWQTHKIAKVLKGRTLEETCRNIWEFVYKHIAYKKDENGKEQVRSPARTWHDRHNFLTDKFGRRIQGGVDCDCGTTLISSILSNLKIRHRLRIVKFANSLGITNDHYSHIYPIVPKPGGGYYTIDFVVHKFNYEEPFREKNDTNMDLEYLNGVYNSDLKTAEAIEFAGMEDDREAFGELGKLFKKKASGGGGGGGAVTKPRMKLKDIVKKGGVKQAAQNFKAKGGIKAAVKKVANLTNKLNPAVVPLRLGMLAAMKINFMKIGSRLKYAYLSDAEAQKRGVDMGKFNRLKQIKTKIENTFYTAGGKPEALKEAILKGRGNKDRDVVAGLGYAPENLYGMDEHAPISRLLGEIYYDEVRGLEGLGELGEPATAATITAATGVLAAIAGLLKQVGNIFPKKSKEAKDFEEGEGASDASATASNETAASNESASQNTNTESTSNAAVNPGTENFSSDASSNFTETPTTKTSGSTNSGSGSGSSENYNSEESQNSSAENNNLPAKTESNLPAENNSESAARGTSNLPALNRESQTPTFWQKNKKVIIGSGIGLGILLLAIGTVIVVKRSGEEKPKAQATHGLSGVPKSRKRKKNNKKAKPKPKIKSKKKDVVSFI